ncbi:hypothetical protein ACHBTE_15295 [Streptomyces sp. M41]|uniref:hypothetical protein n=1 Tax=Streptomyces sp. M41 TaxID=3059412 RepID=UPI00374DDBE9
MSTAGVAGPAQIAAAELRRRHFPAMLAYARLCADEAFARALATEAFDRALQESDVPPDRTPWQYHLLRLVHRIAVEWAAAGLPDRLSSGLRSWLTAQQPPGWIPTASEFPANDSTVGTAFLRLPEVTRAAVWHAVVRQNDMATTGRLLGVEPVTVPALGERALEDFRRAYLDTFADRHQDELCGLFAPLLDLATHRNGLTHSCDLEQHMTECSPCTLARRDLLDLNEHPARVLAGGLLPWGGAALVSRGHEEPEAPSRAAPTHGRIRALVQGCAKPHVAVPAGLLMVILLVRALPTPASLYSADPASPSPPEATTAVPDVSQAPPPLEQELPAPDCGHAVTHRPDPR